MLPHFAKVFMPTMSMDRNSG